MRLLIKLAACLAATAAFLAAPATGQPAPAADTLKVTLCGTSLARFYGPNARQMAEGHRDLLITALTRRRRRPRHGVLNSPSSTGQANGAGSVHPQ